MCLALKYWVEFRSFFLSFIHSFLHSFLPSFLDLFSMLPVLYSKQVFIPLGSLYLLCFAHRKFI